MQPREASRTGTWLVVWGVVGIVIGIVLIVDVGAAVRTLALLVALALVIIGIDEVMVANRLADPTWARVLGAGMIVIGIVCAVWPGITVLILAWLTGIGLLLAGITRLAITVMVGPVEGRALWVLVGALTILAGIVSLAVPDITVLVLALLLGLRMIVIGVVSLRAGLALRATVR